MAPLAGATGYLIALALAADGAWGLHVALGLCTVWCLVAAYLVSRRQVTWYVIVLASVVPPALVGFAFGVARTQTAASLAIGLNVMYAFAKLRCSFLGCCNVPRSPGGGDSWLRSFHIGRLEALASLILASYGALQIIFPMTCIALPLILAHGVVRAGSEYLRCPTISRSPIRRSRLLRLLSVTALAQIALKPQSGILDLMFRT